MGHRTEGRLQIEDRRERIIEAAARLFLTDGLESSSTTRIAEWAGITPVTLYRYFPDRRSAREPRHRSADRCSRRCEAFPEYLPRHGG